jgi:aminotransferase
MRDLTVTISGLSKTFSCTGWRLGHVIAPPAETIAIRKVHDFLTVGAPAPLQEAGAVGLAFGPDYYNQMAQDYRERREILCSALRDAGFRFSVPEGAYYVLADFSELSQSNDREFALWLARERGIATVPGSSFHATPGLGTNYVRFAFCKKTATLEQAAHRIRAIRDAAE